MSFITELNKCVVQESKKLMGDPEGTEVAVGSAAYSANIMSQERNGSVHEWQ